jgi:hypothetical protein
MLICSGVAGPAQLDGGVNRERFERLLLRRLDQHRVGTTREAKRLIGGALEQSSTTCTRRTLNDYPPSRGVVAECADAIERLMKSLRD